LLKTARLYLDVWAHEGRPLPHRRRYGPDENTCIVDNNYYTNAGAANTFLEASSLCRTLEEKRRILPRSAKGIGVQKRVSPPFFEAEAHVPEMDEKLGICKQDDTFLNKKRWNLEEIPPETFRS
jgi:alpha,alpha-trehalose phosphorylase